MMTHALQSGLRADTLEKARVELCERPDAIQQDIQEVRDMIVTRPDIGFLRTDDAFVLRFLRARKFHHFEAFKLLAQYFEYRQQHLDMFKNFKATDQGIRQALRNGFPGVLSHSDHYGRKILVIFASNWDQIRYTFVDILRAILLSLETMIEEPELQVNGFVLIIDWSNFSFKQASKLTPGMLRLAIEGLQRGGGDRRDATARGAAVPSGGHVSDCVAISVVSWVTVREINRGRWPLCSGPSSRLPHAGVFSVLLGVPGLNNLGRRCVNILFWVQVFLRMSLCAQFMWPNFCGFLRLSGMFA
ncbi:clavesin-2-like isoform X2 [Lampetra fluviatilis]